MTHCGPIRPSASQADLLALVREVTAAVAAAGDVDETLELVARASAQALGVWECDIYEYAPAARKLVATATWAISPTPHDEEWIGDTVDVDDLHDFRVALETQRPVELHCDDPDVDPGVRAMMDEWGEKSWLLVPLVFGGQPIGVLELVEEREKHEFTGEEKEIAMTIAVPAAIAIHNARLRRETEEQNRLLASLVSASRAITATVDLDDVLREVARQGCEALHTPQAAVYVYEEERDALVCQALYERGPAVGTVERVGAVRCLDEHPAERPILFSHTLVVEHASDRDLPPDRRDSVDTRGQKTVLSVPLRYRDETLGILRLCEFVQERTFSELELQLASGLGELAGTAIHNAETYRREQTRGLELQTLLEAGKALTSSMDLEETLDTLATRAAVALGSQQCLIYECDDEHDGIALRSSFTPPELSREDADAIGTAYDLADRPTDRQILQRGEIVEMHLSEAGLGADVRTSMETRAEKTCLSVPLVFRDRALGLMKFIDFESERSFTVAELGLVRALADQAAAALNNARLYRRSKEYAARLESTYFETVTALAAAMEAKDHYTAEHADMLATMATSVGRRLGLDESQLRDLQYASVLHDVGKIGVPGHILNKPERLTDEEFAVMAEHTVIGERIISRIDYLAPISKVIRSAHERWDGRGYPDGLTGEHIPRAARILFVCDAFHAMTSDRPYRRAMPEADALDELRRNAGAQFDPEVVAAFLAVWPHFEDAAVAPRTPSLN